MAISEMEAELMKLKPENHYQMIEVQVVASSPKSSERLKNQLAAIPKWADALNLMESSAPLTVVDSGIVVAIVAAAGAGIGSLISGLLQLAKQSATNKIVLQTKDGTRLEVPVNVSAEELDRLIVKLCDIEKERVRILMP